jgi:hypothetical protein
MILTLGLETLAFLRLISLPAGVTVSGAALVLSILVFFAVSWATRGDAGADLDADVRAVMET